MQQIVRPDSDVPVQAFLNTSPQQYSSVALYYDSMIDALIHTLEKTAHTLPLPIFAPLASYLEEVIAPIPSPGIMLLTGSLAQVQGYGLHGLILLILLASAGKTLGALTVYILADKAENIVMRIFGRFLNITHKEIESFGKRFTHSWKDYAFFITIRSLPIVPSVLISFGSGVLRIPKKLFLIGTFIGTCVRDSIYLAIGYTGVTIMHDVLTHASRLEDFILYGAVISIICFALYRIYRHLNTKTLP